MSSTDWSGFFKKLYEDPSDSWRALPTIVRGIGDEILRYANRKTGRVATSCDAKAIASRLGSHPDEIPAIAAAVEALLDQGFLVADDTGLYVTNLVESQAEQREKANARQKKSRGNRRLVTDVTDVTRDTSDDNESRNVTDVTRDTPSSTVTRRDAIAGKQAVSSNVTPSHSDMPMSHLDQIRSDQIREQTQPPSDPPGSARAEWSGDSGGGSGVACPMTEDELRQVCDGVLGGMVSVSVLRAFAISTAVFAQNKGIRYIKGAIRSGVNDPKTRRMLLDQTAAESDPPAAHSTPAPVKPALVKGKVRNILRINGMTVVGEEGFAMTYDEADFDDPIHPENPDNPWLKLYREGKLREDGGWLWLVAS